MEENIKPTRITEIKISGGKDNARIVSVKGKECIITVSNPEGKIVNIHINSNVEFDKDLKVVNDE
jgi:hypothetical protein